jgi:hypothetical protein
MVASLTEFGVRVDDYSEGYHLRHIQVVCRHSEFCSYVASSYYATAALAAADADEYDDDYPPAAALAPQAYVDYDEFQSVVNDIEGVVRELDDGSGLYGSDCPVGVSSSSSSATTTSRSSNNNTNNRNFANAIFNCQGGFVFRWWESQSFDARCPLGTSLEMIVDYEDRTEDVPSILIQPDVGLDVVSLPESCTLQDNGIDYLCDTRTLEIAFTSKVAPCDTSSSTSTTNCPIPLTGRPFGKCLANQPCSSTDATTTTVQVVPNILPSFLWNETNLTETANSFQVTIFSNGTTTSTDDDGLPTLLHGIAQVICRQDNFCSYQVDSAADSNTSFPEDFFDWNAFTKSSTSSMFSTVAWEVDDDGTLQQADDLFVSTFQDGSALYGEAHCPISHCGGVMTRANLISVDGNDVTTTFECPIGTEMQLSLAVERDITEVFILPNDETELSGRLPSECSASTDGIYLCDPSTTTTTNGILLLNFVHTSSPCQPSKPNGRSCILPSTGRAYGNCGGLGDSNTCVFDMSAVEVLERHEALPVPSLPPTTSHNDDPSPSSPTPLSPSSLPPTKSSFSSSSSNRANSGASTAVLVLGILSCLALLVCLALAAVWWRRKRVKQVEVELLPGVLRECGKEKDDDTAKDIPPTVQIKEDQDTVEVQGDLENVGNTIFDSRDKVDSSPLRVICILESTDSKDDTEEQEIVFFESEKVNKTTSHV